MIVRSASHGEKRCQSVCRDAVRVSGLRRRLTSTVQVASAAPTVLHFYERHKPESDCPHPVMVTLAESRTLFRRP